MPNIKSQKDRVVQAKKEALHNKQPATARRDRGGPVFGSVATLPMLATLLFLR